MENLIETLKQKLENKSNLIEVLDYIKSYDFPKIDRKIKNQDFWRELIFRNQIFEIYLIYWSKGFSTKFHNHPNNGCILKVLDGQLKEIILKNNNLIEIIIRKLGETSYINNDIGLHKVEAIEDSISIHIYSPPCYFEI